MHKKRNIFENLAKRKGLIFCLLYIYQSPFEALWNSKKFKIEAHYCPDHAYPPVGNEPGFALSSCRIWTVWMIKESNLRRRTFIYGMSHWCVRHLGSSPIGDAVFLYSGSVFDLKKGAQVWDFRSLRFLWFLYNKVSLGGRLFGLH